MTGGDNTPAGGTVDPIKDTLEVLIVKIDGDGWDYTVENYSTLFEEVGLGRQASAVEQALTQLKVDFAVVIEEHELEMLW